MIERVCTPEEFLELEPRERLAYARKQIELEREAWNQAAWVVTVRLGLTSSRVIPNAVDSVNYCGTAACLAGWVCILAGDRIRTGLDGTPGLCEGVSFSRRADELLGLDGKFHGLYGADNQLEDIDREIARLNDEVYR